MILGCAALAVGLFGAHPELPRVAVLALKTHEVPPAVAAAVTETVATEVARAGVFEVVSAAQVDVLLSLGARQEKLGSCTDGACYARLATLLEAEHVVGGQVVGVGDRLVLDLIWVDAGSGQTVERVHREGSAAALLRQARRAAVTLMQPLLEARSGLLSVRSNVAGAQVSVDDRLRAEGLARAMEVAAGPHVVRVEAEGFYAGVAEVAVRPSQVTEVTVDLIPAEATVRRHRRQARTLRTTAWITAGASVVSGVLAGVFYGLASQNQEFVQAYAGATAEDRASVGTRSEALTAASDFDTHQGAYLALLGTSVLSGLASVGLFVFGPDPHRYDRYAPAP